MPAAAVIPAPVAYIKVVAVKKLVVGFYCPSKSRFIFTRWQYPVFPEFYFEENRAFQAGCRLEYISMV